MQSRKRQGPIFAVPESFCKRAFEIVSVSGSLRRQAADLHPRDFASFTSKGIIILNRHCSFDIKLCIPKALADAIKASDGKRAEIKVENGTLVLRPIVKPARKPRYELLSGMTRDNVPQEVDWGPRRGNEAW